MKSLVLAAGLLLVAACNTHHDESDSKSNWLFSCTSQQDCVQGASCVCGICTKVCADATSCADLAQGQTLCVDPSQQGLPGTCQIDPMLGAQVCLLACRETGECGMQQRCAQGVCISGSIGDDPAPGGLDASGPPVSQPATDSGTPNVGPLDAGTTGPVVNPPPPTTNPPPLPVPDEDAGLRSCPCTAPLVCHVDRTCVKPGVLDSDGVATLADRLPSRAYVYAADADYVYGIEYYSTTGSGELMRWPSAGGAGETLAQGTRFEFGTWRFTSQITSPSASTQPPLIVDTNRLYFLAAADASELSPSLWSMPKDDSQPPTRHGNAGTVLAQDQDYLYFSNDGDSRVLRTGKATLDTSDQREQIYVSQADAPQTILLLAVNTSSIFVTELPPRATDTTTFTIRRIDKAPSTPTVIGTSDRFTTSAEFTFADDAYFVLGGFEDVDRFDLTTAEVKPLGGNQPYLMSFADGVLYGAGGEPTNRKAFWALDLATARRTWLLAGHALYVSSLVAVPGSVFVTANTQNERSVISALLRIVAPK